MAEIVWVGLGDMECYALWDVLLLNSRFRAPGKRFVQQWPRLQLIIVFVILKVFDLLA